VVSAALLAEYHETVEELRLDYPGRKYVAWAQALAESAELVFPVERAAGATPDPGDEMILECALAAEADFIVSGDKKHLLTLREFQGIPIINPVGFPRRLAVK
jgi:predicted nucleic acid-binding protein